MARWSDSNSSRSRTTWPPDSSVRWLWMIRLASSASCSCTEMRTSPLPLTVSGKIEFGTAADMTSGTPWASRRPRTTLASTSECVLKTTTRSATVSGTAHVQRQRLADAARRNGVEIVDLQQNHRHVIVLRRRAHKRLNLAEHALPELVGRE